MEYIINFQNGLTHNIEVDSLEEAKEYAVEEMRFTGENVSIETTIGEVMATSYWIGVSPNESENDSPLVDFNFGFYSEWYE